MPLGIQAEHFPRQRLDALRHNAVQTSGTAILNALSVSVASSPLPLLRKTRILPGRRREHSIRCCKQLPPLDSQSTLLHRR